MTIKRRLEKLAAVEPENVGSYRVILHGEADSAKNHPYQAYASSSRKGPRK